MERHSIDNYKYHGNSIRDFLKHSRFQMLRKLSFAKFLNVGASLLEWKFRRSKLTSKPSLLRVEVSSLCNLKCPGCPTTQRASNGVDLGLMPMKRFERIFNQVEKATWRMSFYIIGEPLTNPRLLDMIEMASSKGIYTHFSSNFTLVRKGMADRMVNSGLDSLSGCLDGFSQKSYSNYRVGGNVEKVKKAIIEIGEAKLKAGSSKPFLNVYTISFSHVIKELEEISSFCSENRVDMLTIRPDQLNFDGSGLENSKRVLRDYSKCFWPWVTMIVDVYGNVYPCQYAHGRVSFGNLIKEDAADIWNNEKYQLTRKFLSGSKISKEDQQKIPCLSCSSYCSKRVNA